MQTNSNLCGIWKQNGPPAAFDGQSLLAHIANVRAPLYVVRDRDGRIGTAIGGVLGSPDSAPSRNTGLELIASLAPIYPEWLGDRSFLETHGVRFPYVAGAMARGIANTDLVIAMARAQMLAFYGAGGLPLEEVQRGIDTIRAALPADGKQSVWGANLIHSPHEPALENAVADLFIKRGVRRVSASAYMRLTPAIVRYAYSGVGVDGTGTLRRQNHVFAKISRPEVAEQFMSPAPQKILDQLVAAGLLSAAEANLATQLPVAEDVTVEADSGGHTDNRPLPALFPTILSLRDELCRKHQYTRTIRVGAAGGIGTPSAVASAFAMGAAYVLTGSINQATVEAGISTVAKQMLTTAGIADVAMAPSPDMFELGIRVQVLKRGTLFASRAQLLFDLYSAHKEWTSIPKQTRDKVEGELFKRSYEEVWAETEAFWKTRSPKDVDKAQRDPRHQMALVFRWYVGLSSHWAITGDSERQLDYQIWCGPAQGAFNAWARGTFLEALQNRSVVQIARNLLEGAAVISRAQQLRSYGVDVPRVAFDYQPTPLS